MVTNKYLQECKLSHHNGFVVVNLAKDEEDDWVRASIVHRPIKFGLTEDHTCQ